jgi:hypothetical protein
MHQAMFNDRIAALARRRDRGFARARVTSAATFF